MHFDARCNVFISYKDSEHIVLIDSSAIVGNTLKSTIAAWIKLNDFLQEFDSCLPNNYKPIEIASHFSLLLDLLWDVIVWLTHQANGISRRAFDVSVAPLRHKASQFEGKMSCPFLISRHFIRSDKLGVQTVSFVSSQACVRRQSSDCNAMNKNFSNPDYNS